MSKNTDTYKTISAPSKEVLFKDKNSKFFGYAFPVTTEATVKLHLTNLKKQHYAARHWCYAWQLGTNPIRYRANDDGEPNNSAGMPIYGQIQSFEVTNILIVVVRYFGGVKLGVSGLINAYRTAAQLSLESAHIVEQLICTNFTINCDYKHLNTVMRIIKEKQLTITHQKMELQCAIEISVRRSEAETIFSIFNTLHEISIQKL